MLCLYVQILTILKEIMIYEVPFLLWLRYWLYAAVKLKCLLVTNDEMRDHIFELLGSSFFLKWKERHQVRYSMTTLLTYHCICSNFRCTSLRLNYYVLLSVSPTYDCFYCMSFIIILANQRHRQSLEFRYTDCLLHILFQV